MTNSCSTTRSDLAAHALPVRDLVCPHCERVIGRYSETSLYLGSVYVCRVTVMFCTACGRKVHWGPEGQTKKSRLSHTRSARHDHD